MNTDTQNQLTQIKRQGWYNHNETFGEGGVAALYEINRGWKSYQLLIVGESDEVHTITARNDEVAGLAFHQTFDLRAVEYQIVEIKITYRTIENRVIE